MNKFAIITAFLGETRNRYMVYQGSRTLAERLKMAKGIPGLDGLELCYPGDFEKPAELKALLAQYDFGLSGMNFRSRRSSRKAGSVFISSRRGRAKGTRTSRTIRAGLGLNTMIRSAR